MTNQLQTHHLVLGALLGLAAALVIPAAFVVVFAGAVLALGLKLTKHERLATVRR